MSTEALPLPPHFEPDQVGQVRKVDYQAVAQAASDWARRYGIPPAHRDQARICLLLIDVQNTFCSPGFELYVGGPSGTGAVDDSRRTCSFLYQNLARIHRVVVTMDTHQAMQIFHSLLLVDASGRPPEPYTTIDPSDVAAGRWQLNADAAASLGLSAEESKTYLARYVGELASRGKYALTVWPFHAMLGGIGHALVAAIEEAVFFHTVARMSQAQFVLKGQHPLTEHYSALGAEVPVAPIGGSAAADDRALAASLLTYDAIIVAGQAKSHCVAWTLDDLLSEIQARDPRLAERVYLLDDCTSPVVVPGVVDYSAPAEAAFARFAAAGMRVVRSVDPMPEWPGMERLLA